MKSIGSSTASRDRSGHRKSISCKLANFLFLILSVLGAGAQVLTGTVKNGTTNKPAVGDDVILMKLEKGMAEEARTKTNSKGEFSLTIPNVKVPHVIRVRHQNVNYHEPVFPGSNSVNVTVYNAAPKVEGIKRTDHSIIFQADPTTLQVIELFNVVNTSQPPLTQPSFEFYLPDGASVTSGQVASGTGMPLKNAPVPQEEKGKYAFLYPLRPGQTHFEVVYQLPYTGSFKYKPKLAEAVDKLFVVTPKAIQFSAADGSSYRADQWPIEPQMNVDTHVIDNAQPTTETAFQISGVGRLPEDAPAQTGNGRQGGEDTRPGGGLGVPNEKPNPISGGQWAFLGVLTVFMAGGAAFIFITYRTESTVPVPARGKSSSLLDALKEEMFQLEADRLHNKIAPQEYEITKAALDKTLQRAMKRKGGK